MIVGGYKAPHLFKQHVCRLPCAMQPRRYAARAACAALSPIASLATLAATSTREPEAAILEGRFPQLEGALIPEIVGVGLTRWSYLGFAVELDSHVWCSRYLIQTYYHVISSADRATIMISEPLPPLNDQAAGAILIECFKPHHLSQVSSCTRAATTFFTPLGNG